MILLEHGKLSLYGQARAPSSYHLHAHELRQLVAEGLFGYGQMSERDVEQAVWEGIRAVSRLRREGRVAERQARLALEVLAQAYVQSKLLRVIGRFQPALFSEHRWPALL